MAKLSWVIFCERSVVDSATNSLSLMNIVEEIHPPAPTKEQLKEAAGRTIGAGMQCAVVSYWGRSHANKQERPSKVMLRLIDPDNAKQIEAIQELDFGNATRARLVANLQAIPAGREGTYVWRVYLRQKSRWKVVGEISYELSYLSSPAELKRLMKTARRNAAKSPGQLR
jgi:hypothetical protein